MDTAKSTGTIVSLVIAVGISVLILILLSTLTGRTFETIEDDIAEIGVHDKIVAENFTADNTTYIQLAHGDIQLGTIVIVNQTSCDYNNCTLFTSVSANGDNFTFVLADGTVKLTAAGQLGQIWNSTPMYINYSWGRTAIAGSVRGAIYGGFLAFENVGDYLPIIVLAIIMGIILTIILGYTGYSGGETGKGGTAL